MILFLGDSLTRGTVGYTYIKFMAARPHKNRGKNGDSTFGALTRLMRCRERGWYGSVDAVVVFIGTNDILRPFLCRYSKGFRRLYEKRVRKSRCADDAEEFSGYYREIMERLRADGKRVIAVGLTRVQLVDYPAERLREYSDIIRSLADEYGADYIDPLTLQDAAVPDARNTFDWGQSCIPRGLDILTMGLLPFTKEWFSTARRLEFTVDGIHLNNLSARLIAAALDEKLAEGGVGR